MKTQDFNVQRAPGVRPHRVPFSLKSSNPYLDIFTQISGGDIFRTSRWDFGSFNLFMRQWQYRDNLVKTYAWSIPTQEAIHEIAQHGPVLEVFAGTGYWACMLQRYGVDVLAYDGGIRSDTWHAPKHLFTRVRQGLAEDVAGRFPERTLFLSWPPMDDSAYHALRNYWNAGGRTVAYVGEYGGGCTGTEAFWDALNADFEESATVCIPQYCGVHDLLSIWKRR